MNLVRIKTLGFKLEQSPSGISWSPNDEWIAFSIFVPQAAPQLTTPPKKPKGAEWATS